MIFRILFLFLCVSVCSLVRAQEKLIAMKYVGSALLSPNYPSWMIGVELKPFKHWSLSGDYGIQAPSFLFQWNSGKRDIHLKKLKLAVRYYPFEYAKNVYFSGEVYGLAQSYVRYDNWYITDEGTLYEYAVAFIAKMEKGYTLHAGINLFTGERFYFDFSTGLGQRWVDVKYDHFIGLSPLPSTFEGWDRENDRKEGMQKKYQIMLSARIGFLVFKTKS